MILIMSRGSKAKGPREANKKGKARLPKALKDMVFGFFIWIKEEEIRKRKGGIEMRRLVKVFGLITVIIFLLGQVAYAGNPFGNPFNSLKNLAGRIPGSGLARGAVGAGLSGIGRIGRGAFNVGRITGAGFSGFLRGTPSIISKGISGVRNSGFAKGAGSIAKDIVKGPVLYSMRINTEKIRTYKIEKIEKPNTLKVGMGFKW